MVKKFKNEKKGDYSLVEVPDKAPKTISPAIVQPKITKVTSRPTGVSAQNAVDITNLDKKAQDQISTDNALAGQKLAKLSQENRVNKIVTDEIGRNLTPTELSPEAQQTLQQQPVPEPDNRSTFSKIFAPTAQEGAQRRLNTFGTESIVPPILAAGAIAATGGLATGLVAGGATATAAGTASTAGTVAAETGLTAGAIPAVSTSIGSIVAGLAGSKTFLFSALSYAAGKTSGEFKSSVKDGSASLYKLMDGASASVNDINNGLGTAEDAALTINAAESGIEDLERALKIYSLNPLNNVGKYRSQIFIAREQLNRLREKALINQQQQDLRIATQQYGTK